MKLSSTLQIFMRDLVQMEDASNNIRDHQLNVDRQNALRQEQEQFPLVGPLTSFSESSIPGVIQWNEQLLKKAIALFSTPENQVATEDRHDQLRHSAGNGSAANAHHHQSGFSYRGLREVRRDGNCFIRSVVFRSLELMIGRPDLATTCVAFVDGIAPVLCKTFSEYVQDFCDVFRDIVVRLQNGSISLASQLHAEVCSPDQSEYLIFFFRYVISNYIRNHAAIFAPYIVDFPTVDEYCCSEVEAVAKECEQIHVTALCNAMNLPMVVQYVDLSPSEKAVEHVMEPMVMGDEGEDGPLTARFLPEGEAVHLLYRPGHYDILYPARPSSLS